MKKFAISLNSITTNTKALDWFKLIAVTGSTQLFVQAISLFSGILVIRLLSTQEYALYTLANTMLGMMIILADGGIATGVMAHGGKSWQNPEKLGVILATGFDLRNKFALGSLLVATPLLLLLLRHHNASWLMAILVVAALVPAFFMSLSGTLLEIAPKLQQDIAPLQKIQLGSSIGRFALLCSMLFVFPWAFVAIFAASLPQIWANKRTRAISIQYADWNQKPDAAIRKDILLLVKRVFPGAVYYCVSGQITLWLISFFGSTAAVAQIGALGRLAMVLNVFSTLITTLVAPRFARMPDDKTLLLKRYAQIQGSLLVLTAGILLITWAFPSQILWILGKDYSNLKLELLLNIAGSCLAMIAGISFTLCVSRGWAVNPLISVSASLASMVCAIFLFDISSLKGILLFNILVVCSQVITHNVYGFMKIIKTKQEYTLT